MKKLVLAALAVGILAGCAGKPPVALEPKGEVTPVNAANINLSDLRAK